MSEKRTNKSRLNEIEGITIIILILTGFMAIVTTLELNERYEAIQASKSECEIPESKVHYKSLYEDQKNLTRDAERELKSLRQKLVRKDMGSWAIDAWSGKNFFVIKNRRPLSEKGIKARSKLLEIIWGEDEEVSENKDK